MQNKPFIRSSLSAGSVPLVLLFLAAPSPVFAGFQWVAPGGAPSVETYTPPFPAAPVQAAPVQQKSPAPNEDAYPVVTPQIIEAPAPSKPSASSFVPVPEHILVPPKGVEAVGQSAPKEEEKLRGFGNNVPLSVALRQILPSEKGYVVDPGVSLGQMVSWKGGAPWRAVLADALKPVGLATKEDGQLVRIVPAVQAATPSDVGSPTPSSGLVVVNETGKRPDLAELSTPSSEPVYLVPPAQELSELAPKAEVVLPPAMPVKAPAPAQSSAPTSILAPSSFVPPAMPPASVAPPPGTMGYLAPPSRVASAVSGGLPGSLLSSGSDVLVEAWTAEKGQTLRQTLQNWSRRSNIELAWQAEFDFPLQASVSLNGTFEEAVRSLLRGFEGASPQPMATLHNNQVAGQSVLVVTTRGNKYDD